MRADPIAAAQRPRRGHSGRLENALRALALGHGSVIEHRERSWASITFAGTRHTLCITFDSPEAIEGGEALIACLPDHEFAIPGYLVADAQVIGATHTMAPEPKLVVEVELLLLEE